MRNTPPLLFYMIGIVYLMASLASLFGVLQTISSWNWLIAVNYQPGPLYNVFENSFFSLAFLVSAVVLWMRKPWAPLFGQVSAVLAAAWFWVDRILFTKNPLAFSQHLFPLAVSFVLLAFMLLSLSLLKPNMKMPSPVNPANDNPGVNNENTPA